MDMVIGMVPAEVIRQLPRIVTPTYVKRAHRAIQEDYEQQCAIQQHLNMANSPSGPVHNWMQNFQADAR
eukprot:4258490-Karenia_brevis.AAC.1